MQKRSAASAWLIGAVPLVLFLGFSLLAYTYASPEMIVSAIGIENSYLLMLVTAFFSAMVLFYPMPHYPMLVLLATSGLNPILLGVATAIGMTLGDYVSYLVGYQGERIIPPKAKRMMKSIEKVIEKHPRLFPIFCFFYGAMSPFSNDLLTIPAGFLRYSHVKVVIPLSFGNLVFNITLAYIASHTFNAVAAFLS